MSLVMKSVCFKFFVIDSLPLISRDFDQIILARKRRCTGSGGQDSCPEQRWSRSRSNGVDSGRSLRFYRSSTRSRNFE